VHLRVHICLLLWCSDALDGPNKNPLSNLDAGFFKRAFTVFFLAFKTGQQCAILHNSIILKISLTALYMLQPFLIHRIAFNGLCIHAKKTDILFTFAHL
jgi:hypothetical protein